MRNGKLISVSNIKIEKSNDVDNYNKLTDNSYEEEDKKKIEDIDFPKEKYFFGYNSKSRGGNEKYIERIASLNKINTKIFQENTNNINNSEMNDIIFKFRKTK